MAIGIMVGLCELPLKIGRVFAMAGPVFHRDRSAHRVGAEGSLLGKPIRRDDRVRIGESQPLRSQCHGYVGAVRPRKPDVSHVDPFEVEPIARPMTTRRCRRSIATGIEHNNNDYRFTMQPGMVRRATQSSYTCPEKRLFVVGRDHDSDHGWLGDKVTRAADRSRAQGADASPPRR